MTLGLSQARSNDALIVGTSVSLVGGGSPSFIGDPLAMFTPWGFDTTKITNVTGTVTLRIDLPSLAIRDALAVWHNMVKGAGAMRIINSAGPTTVQSWSPQDPRAPRLLGSFRGFWRRLVATAFDRIEFDFTPGVTVGSEPGDVDPIEIFRFHVASDVVEVPSVATPLSTPSTASAPSQSGISQRRGRPLNIRQFENDRWLHITFATVGALLNIWKDSNYGGCPVVSLKGYDSESGGAGEGANAQCARLIRASWRPRIQPADSWTFAFDTAVVTNEQYPLGPEATF